MSASTVIGRFEQALTSDVMSPLFENKMRSIAREVSFSCVFFGGQMYDFSFYSNHVGGDFRHGNVGLPSFKSTDSFYALLSFWLTQLDGCHLFIDNFVDAASSVPSIGAASSQEIREFISRWATLPTNMVIAKGDKLLESSDAVVGIADVSDGLAWLVAFGRSPST